MSIRPLLDSKGNTVRLAEEGPEAIFSCQQAKEEKRIRLEISFLHLLKSNLPSMISFL